MITFEVVSYHVLPSFLQIRWYLKVEYSNILLKFQLYSTVQGNFHASRLNPKDSQVPSSFGRKSIKNCAVVSRSDLRMDVSFIFAFIFWHIGDQDRCFGGLCIVPCYLNIQRWWFPTFLEILFTPILGKDYSHDKTMINVVETTTYVKLFGLYGLKFSLVSAEDYVGTIEL